MRLLTAGRSCADQRPSDFMSQRKMAASPRHAKSRHSHRAEADGAFERRSGAVPQQATEISATNNWSIACNHRINPSVGLSWRIGGRG